MTLLAQNTGPILTLLGLTTLPDLLKLATRIAYNWCRRNNRIGLAIYDEAEAEAWYITMILIEKHLEKFQLALEPLPLYRMKVGYELTKYFMHFKAGTVSRAKREGRFVPKIITLEFGYWAKSSDDLGYFIMLDYILRDTVDWAIYEQLCISDQFEKTPESIAKIVGLTLEEYKLKRRAIKRRLRLEIPK